MSALIIFIVILVVFIVLCIVFKCFENSYMARVRQVNYKNNNENKRSLNWDIQGVPLT